MRCARPSLQRPQEIYGGGLEASSSVTTITATLFANNVASVGGGVAEGSGFEFYNCTMKHNVAVDGGVLHGGGDFEDCVLIGNEADSGGVAYATAVSTLTRCIIGEGAASRQGAAMYSVGAAIKVRDSLVYGFTSGDASADDGGCANTCAGRTCEYWISEEPDIYSCLYLELNFNCDCSGE